MTPNSVANALDISSTSIGATTDKTAYLCLVSKSGEQFYFNITPTQAWLIGKQAIQFAERTLTAKARTRS